MSEIDINAALVQGLVASSLGLPIGHEGRDFDPPAPDAPWCSWFNLPASTDPISIGVGGNDETTGIFQVDLNYPLNKGTADILAAVQALRDYFVSGRRLEYNGQCLHIRRVVRNNLRPVDGWQQINVSIYYDATTTRPEV